MKMFLASTLILTCVSGLAAAQSDTRCYELRVYYAAPGKLDTLEDRFRDHTCGLLAKHGFTNIGYWVPIENPDNMLIYIIASPNREAHDKAWQSFAADLDWRRVVQMTETDGKPITRVDRIYLDAADFSPQVAPSHTDSPRCFELRTYTAAPNKMDALLTRFRDHTLKLFERHGMTNIGYWTRTDKERNQLIYVLAHKSKEASAESFKNFRTDPEWQEAKKASEANGSLTEKVESVLMKPLDFSPIK